MLGAGDESGESVRGKWMLMLVWCIGVLCLVYLICSLRTNVAFFLIFLSLVVAFPCLAAAYWNLALAYENPENTGALTNGENLTVVSSVSNVQKDR